MSLFKFFQSIAMVIGLVALPLSAQQPGNDPNRPAATDITNSSRQDRDTNHNNYGWIGLLGLVGLSGLLRRQHSPDRVVDARTQSGRA